MSIDNLNLRAFMRVMLNTDCEGDLVVDFAMKAFKVDRDTISKLWNDLLCKSHGI